VFIFISTKRAPYPHSSHSFLLIVTISVKSKIDLRNRQYKWFVSSDNHTESTIWICLRASCFCFRVCRKLRWIWQR